MALLKTARNGDVVRGRFAGEIDVLSRVEGDGVETIVVTTTDTGRVEQVSPAGAQYRDEPVPRIIGRRHARGVGHGEVGGERLTADVGVAFVIRRD